MAFKIIIPLLFFATVVAYPNDDLIHSVINDANLIETAQGYAMNSPILEQDNIKTVSVNDEQIQIFYPNCQQVTITKRGELAQFTSYQNLLLKAKMPFNSAGTNQPQQLSPNYAGPIRSVRVHYYLNQNSVSINSPNMNVASFNFDGISFQKYDDQSMSIKRSNFPPTINRIFFTKDVVTFVYNDGQVQMRPRHCLPDTEQQWILQLQSEVQQAEIRFKEHMRQFQLNLEQNMRSMQQNMQQNMRNFNMRMRNMFNPANGFMAHGPFNSYSQAQMMQNGAYAQAGTGYTPGGINFGNSWPFGPNNNPFRPGFPF